MNEKWRPKHTDEKFSKQDALRDRAVYGMERAMLEAVDYILEHYSWSRDFSPPSLYSMDGVMESFYRHIVEQAYHSAKAEKRHQSPHRHLAAPGPVGLPRTMRSLVQVFSDHRYWPKIMKRSKKLTERLRKAYLQKLRKKFEEIVPQMDRGEIDPLEAKEMLMQSWRASKNRVATIFQTETTTYFAKTQTAFFEGDPDIIGFLFDSVRDSGRTDWCRTRHGLVYRPGTKALRENTPACHWRCRSHLIALANTASNRKLLEDPERDPARRRVEPLPHGWKK